MTRQKAIGTVLSSAGLIAFFSLVSRILGLLRDRLLAGEFGADVTLDAYYAAFKIPDFLYNLLVLGALTAAFVPVVANFLAKNKPQEANRVTSAVMTILGVSMAGLSLIALFALPWLITLTAPGFDGETRELTLNITRIMLLSPIIFGISSVISSFLNTTRHFLAYALAPVFYNIGIIAGVLFLVPKVGPSGLAWGVVVGAGLHLLVQLPALFKAGFRFSVSASWLHPGVRRIIVLAGPRVLSIAALQINVVVITAIASTLPTGSVSTYNLAFNLQSLPLGLVGISIATAVFPVLAELASRNEAQKFVHQITETFRHMMFLIVPLSVALLVLRVPIVRIALGSGAFNFEDTYATAAALALFSLSLFAQTIVPLLTRAFYALEDTKTTVVISVISVGFNIIAGIYLGRQFGLLGLVVAFSAAAILDFLLHLLILRNRLGQFDDRVVVVSVVKTVFAAAIGGAGALVVREVLVRTTELDTFISVLLLVLASSIVGAMLYLGAHTLMRSPEVGDILAVIRPRKKITNLTDSAS